MEEKGLVKIQTDAGELSLSPAIIRKYLVNGNGAVTDSEVMMFLGLCRYQRLNPFLREAYLVKYGTQPATIITGKEAFLKRAMKARDCRGFKAGVVIQKGEDLVHTDGVVPTGAKLVGGWAEVHRDGWVFPLRVEVSFQEYVGKKGDGSPNKMWTEKPATMIRKVALVQALREAFPEDLAGMYSPEEIDTNEDLPNTPVPIDDRAVDIGAPAPQQEMLPKQENKPEGRRRRNKFVVDRSVFGSDEIMTCGATPDQLMKLKSVIRGSDLERSGRIKSYLNSIGYQELSFLRHDEAQELLAIPVVDDQETVNCPMNPGDKVYRSFCEDQCETRQRDGWCPAIESPPDMEDGI